MALKTNGLGGDGLLPWHMKASVQAFDETGKPQAPATLEVFWAGPRKFKQIYSSGDFARTEYWTGDGVYVSGSATPPPYPFEIVTEQLLRPLPSQAEIDDFSPEKREQSFGSVKLQCVMLSQKIPRLSFPPLGLFPTYCFSPEKPILRFGTFSGGIQAVFNNLVLFQGRYLAKSIAISDRGAALANITMEQIQGIPQINEADFAHPADATKGYADPVAVAGGVMAGNISRKVPPRYPQSAKANRVSGKVVLNAIIGRDGRIHRLKVVSSPDPDLAVASLAAVQQWTYKPYLLEGRPVEVNTTINVVFALGG